MNCYAWYHSHPSVRILSGFKHATRVWDATVACESQGKSIAPFELLDATYLHAIDSHCQLTGVQEEKKEIKTLFLHYDGERGSMILEGGKGYYGATVTTGGLLEGCIVENDALNSTTLEYLSFIERGFEIRELARIELSSASRGGSLERVEKGMK